MNLKIKSALNTARLCCQIAKNESSVIYLNRAKESLQLAKNEVQKYNEVTDTKVIPIEYYLDQFNEFIKKVG